MAFSSPLRLILVRHGEAVGNAEGCFLGTRDDPLTKTGLQQAEAIATTLAPFNLGVIYTSPLRRAQETADILARKTGLMTKIDGRLREQCFGSWEGRKVKGTVADNPRAAIPWTDLDPCDAPPGGESLRDVEIRVKEFIADFERTFSAGWFVLVTHVGPIKALLCSALAVPLETAKRIFLDPATITVIDWKPSRLVRLVNGHPHSNFSATRWAKD